jgi:Rrf2 family protein
MKFNTKTRYGIRTMLEIAYDVSQLGVLQKEIALNQNISVKYLDYIIHALKVAGLITNANGKKRGYILSRKPSDITIYDIHNAFEHGVCIVDCLSAEMICVREKRCTVRKFWVGLNTMIIDYLKNTTLEDLVKQEYKEMQSILK